MVISSNFLMTIGGLLGRYLREHVGLVEVCADPYWKKKMRQSRLGMEGEEHRSRKSSRTEM